MSKDSVSAAPKQLGERGTAEYWAYIIVCSTRGLTDAQVHQAARWCAAEETAGRIASAWHAASVVCGTLDKCCCCPCINARTAQAKATQ